MTDVTIEQAVEEYLESRGSKGALVQIEHSTYRKVEVLLNKRLIPFCKANGILYVRAIGELDLCRKFVESWRNLLSTRNKKHLPELDLPLGDRTRGGELERFRAFSAFCLDNKWIELNAAKNLKIKTSKPCEKFGLELEEYERVLDALELVTDNRRLNQPNSKELRAIVELMRWSGLRISDATMFNDTGLQRNTNDTGWIARVFMKKRGNGSLFRFLIRLQDFFGTRRSRERRMENSFGSGRRLENETPPSTTGGMMLRNS